MTLQPPIPVLRIFDLVLAKAFYLDWLGFKLDWEHQLASGAPKYLQVSRGAVVLHLSEHYGDCSPGAKVFIHTDDVDAIHRELSERPNPNMRPGVELAPWNARVMVVVDPFGNRLCFNQSLSVRDA
jgi:catechol 2,3-dioxygenase-like lactoylglutathione lyase family enzyme